MSCGPRCGDRNAIPAKRRRAGERSSTAGSRGPGPETDDAGEVRAYGELRWLLSRRGGPSHRRLPRPHRAAIKADPAFWTSTASARHWRGAREEEQAKRSAEEELTDEGNERREVAAAVASCAELAIVEASGAVPSMSAVETEDGCRNGKEGSRNS